MGGGRGIQEEGPGGKKGRSGGHVDPREYEMLYVRQHVHLIIE